MNKRLLICVAMIVVLLTVSSITVLEMREESTEKLMGTPCPNPLMKYLTPREQYNVLYKEYWLKTRCHLND